MPASEKKIAANRANAARSTGPRTPEGKAKSSMNAVKHGLTARSAVLPGEDRGEREAMARALLRDLAPQGLSQRILAARIVALAWKLRRVAPAEAAAWEVPASNWRRWADDSPMMRIGNWELRFTVQLCAAVRKFDRLRKEQGRAVHPQRAGAKRTQFLPAPDPPQPTSEPELTAENGAPVPGTSASPRTAPRR